MYGPKTVNAALPNSAKGTRAYGELRQLSGFSSSERTSGTTLMRLILNAHSQNSH